MYASRSCALCYTSDQLLDFLSCDQHEIGKLVYDHYYVGHFCQRWWRMVFLATNWLIERVWKRFSRTDCSENLAVVPHDIPNAEGCHQPKSAIHFAYAPAKRVGGFAHISDNRRQ